MEKEIIKAISEKYKKREKFIEVIIEFLLKEGYNKTEIINIIENFYKLKNNAVSNAVGQIFSDISK